MSIPGCVYRGLEFVGGSLGVVSTVDFSTCKSECEATEGCTFFTITAAACVLKGEDVTIRSTKGAVSGMVDKASGGFILH